MTGLIDIPSNWSGVDFGNGFKILTVPWVMLHRIPQYTSHGVEQKQWLESNILQISRWCELLVGNTEER
jgi:hypothetical protein